MSEFIEGWHGPQIHPHAAPVVGDAREDVIRALDGVPEPTVQQLARELAAQELRRIFEVVRGQREIKPGVLEYLGRRFLLVVWIVNSSLLTTDGRPISLRKLAAQLGCSAPNLAPDSAELSRALGIRNEFQLHDWRRDEHRDPLESVEDNNGGELEET